MANYTKIEIHSHLCDLAITLKGHDVGTELGVRAHEPRLYEKVEMMSLMAKLANHRELSLFQRTAVRNLQRQHRADERHPLVVAKPLTVRISKIKK